MDDKKELVIIDELHHCIPRNGLIFGSQIKKLANNIEIVSVDFEPDFEVLKRYCGMDVGSTNGDMSCAVTIKGGLIHQEMIEYMNQFKEPEKHDFKCQANHRDKGHVKPFYRRGRW